MGRIPLFSADRQGESFFRGRLYNKPGHLILEFNNKELPVKIKALLFALMFFGAICALAVYVPDAEAKCIYCGSENKGDCGKALHNRI